MSNVESLTVNRDGCIVIPATVVDQLDLAPGQSVDVVSDEKQLRLSRPEVHAYADWRHISHGLLDGQEE
ncbi:MAG: AbrB/MazE/SpoVT family DNA-binding domain-containing protein [Pseudomonadota bacterium]